ncbi:tRNA-specific 2-thiouridylase MnmA [Thalassobaculum fulvum]|uniref:tRNA-specific 2-thiouridylase MnmA n=1 Tax=Thalassobaculum fulvum TaxID=1633335 RepID=A0A919CSB7_9PROT|nr:tRNA-specific 2-thiouridylase MnmA [Thalassobaculum fulvum]
MTAALLKEAGYDVVGITLQLYDHGAAVARKGACCAGSDIHDARTVAERIGIPHYVLDYESRFRESVVDDFADSYLRGETPIPCVRCNQTVKFRDLAATARDLGAEALATGHYVRRVVGPDGPELHRAADPAKDQSYFLFATTPEQLGFLRFPLGGMDKDATRAEARRLGLAVQDKPDSQDICFVPNGNYAEVVRRLRPGAVDPGEIVHLDGSVLGRHDGIIGYTIGQRRGLGIGGRRRAGGGGPEGEADTDPLYVVRLEPETRRVVVGPREALAAATVLASEVNWLGGGDGIPAEGGRVLVKLRSTQPPAAATVWPAGGGRAAIVLDEPQYGVSAGQAAVLYAPQGSRVLGGGWIRGIESSAPGLAPARAGRA